MGFNTLLAVQTRSPKKSFRGFGSPILWQLPPLGGRDEQIEQIPASATAQRWASISAASGHRHF
eukprot:1176611-Prymnesium_polylepis.1